MTHPPGDTRKFLQESNQTETRLVGSFVCNPHATPKPPLRALITALYCLSCGASQGDPAVQVTCPSGHLLMVSWVVCFTSISPRRVPDWSDPHGNPCQSQCIPLLWVTVTTQGVKWSTKIQSRQGSRLVWSTRDPVCLDPWVPFRPLKRPFPWKSDLTRGVKVCFRRETVWIIPFKKPRG